MIAWMCLGNEPSPFTFGSVLGIVCGMMCNVALKELFFGSARYDPLDKTSTKAFAGGMAFMALSLILLDHQMPNDT